MKKLFMSLVATFLAVSLLIGFSGASHASSTTLTIYMPIEYIDESVLANFERQFGVTVVLEEFESNEDMYAEVTKSSKYDLLVPSDYMVDRLLQEGLLAKLDHALLPSLKYISEQYLGAEYDQGNDYHVPYMVGTLGILYNRRAVQISTWQDAFSTAGVLMVDSERDVVGAALKMLGYSMNSTNDSELEEARQALQGIKSNIAGYYDSAYIVDLIAAQESFVGIVYSGDGTMAVNMNPSLAYIVPEEGSNVWADAFVIPASSSNIGLAHEFINFMCSPHIAICNMSMIGYTSPVQDAWSEFASNPIMFPSNTELARCETYIYSAQIVEKQGKIWADIRKD